MAVRIRNLDREKSLKEKYSRHSGIISQHGLVPISVVGVGAIGRNAALQMASLGVPEIQLIDFDNVEISNVATQGFRETEVGKSKVSAVADEISTISPETSIESICDRWRPKIKLHKAVLVCVDSIHIRELIWKAANRKIDFLCDGRMLGSTMRVVTCERGESSHYKDTLFPIGEAEEGRCTTKGIIYTACIAAGLMVNQYVLWRRGFPYHKDMTLNLLAGDLECSKLKQTDPAKSLSV